MTHTHPHQHGTTGPEPHVAVTTDPQDRGRADEAPATHPETVNGGAEATLHRNAEEPVGTAAAGGSNMPVAALCDEHGYMREDVPAALRRAS